MSKVNWSKAPEGAEFYACNTFWMRGKDDKSFYWFIGDSWIFEFDGNEPNQYNDYEPRPVEWPETDERINRIGRDRTEDDLGHYDDIREQEQVKAQQEALQNNKYDRAIYGKYGTGKCTVDVYRVLDAFDTGSAEIDHAIKKLLCAGQRGSKGKTQDWLEAIQSIEAALRLEDCKKV